MRVPFARRPTGTGPGFKYLPTTAVASSRAAKNKLLSAFVDLGFNWVYLGQYRPTAEDIEAIKAVTVADINALVEQFNPGDFTLLSMGPGGAS